MRTLLPLLLLLSACTPYRVDAVGEDDHAVWLEVRDATGEWPLVGHAFVLTTEPDYCALFAERWAREEEALLALDAAMSGLPDGPSQARCEARLGYWQTRLEAERLLYYQDARHTVLFLNQITSSNGVPLAAGTPADGRTGVADDWPDDGLPSLSVTTTRANTLVGDTPQEVLDCSNPTVQESTMGSFLYPGPPREVWQASSGRLELEAVDDDAWALGLSDGELQFVQEIAYEAPSDANDWDPRVTYTDPRDAVAIGFDREFARCPVEVGQRQWLRLLLWVENGAY